MVDLLDFSRRLNALSQAALECGKFLLDSNCDRDDVATILRGQIDAVILQLEGRPDTLPPAGATPPVPLPPAPRPETGSVTARTGANISFEDRLKTCRPFLQQIVEAARHEPPLPDFPALDKTTGNFPLGNSFAKLYEQACTARKRDQEEGGADELGKLQGSNKNPGNQKSFLEICQLSDPAGRMIHWKGWLEPTPPPEPVPQPHPVYAFSQPVAVIDFATELECDCPTSGCKLADELRYRIGVGTVDCLGGSHCHCEDGKVEVQVKRWLPHSEVSDVHEEVPSALETPRKLADDGRQHAVGPYMWPIELLRPIDFSEWERLHEPPPKKRGRKAKGGDGGDGTSEVLRTLGRAEGVGVDTDEDDASYSTQSELPDPESDDEEHPTPEKKQKTKQKTKQTQKTSRATRSSARAQT